jgi:hypothetical protein
MRCTFFLFVRVAGQHIDLSKNDCRKVKTNVYRSTCVVLLMLIYTSESENYCQDVSLFRGRSLSVAGGYPSPAPYQSDFKIRKYTCSRRFERQEVVSLSRSCCVVSLFVFKNPSHGHPSMPLGPPLPPVGVLGRCSR